MEGKFTHYLITRYNVHLDGWGHDRSGAPTRDEAWMKHRESLFRRFCFPSVITQSTTAFRWLIYIQVGTPEAWIQPIRELVQSHSHFSLRMVDGYGGCMNDIDQEMRQANTPYVITSRLDNDDGLAIRYMEYVQSNFVPEPHSLINLTEGIGYHPASAVATRLKGLKLNSFSSYIETRLPEGGHISVRGFQHGAPPEGTRIINVVTPPAWMKIFHDRNLKSTPFGYPIFSKSFRSLFGITKDHLPIHLFATAGYAGRWLADGIYRKLVRPLWT